MAALFCLGLLFGPGLLSMPANRCDTRSDRDGPDQERAGETQLNSIVGSSHRALQQIQQVVTAMDRPHQQQHRDHQTAGVQRPPACPHPDKPQDPFRQPNQNDDPDQQRDDRNQYPAGTNGA